MTVTGMVALFSSLAIALLLGAGGLWSYGFYVTAAACGILGAGWLGILQGMLLSMIGTGTRLDPSGSAGTAPETPAPRDCSMK